MCVHIQRPCSCCHLLSLLCFYISHVLWLQDTKVFLQKKASPNICMCAVMFPETPQKYIKWSLRV